MLSYQCFYRVLFYDLLKLTLLDSRLCDNINMLNKFEDKFTKEL